MNNLKVRDSIKGVCNSRLRPAHYRVPFLLFIHTQSHVEGEGHEQDISETPHAPG